MIDKFEGRYRFLSNFYPCKVEHQGITYNSVEHFYVAMKSNDEQLVDGKYYTTGDLREFVATIPTATEVKRFGRKLKLRKDWETKKMEVMNYGVREKFKNELLKTQLLETGNEELIEGNYWHDNFYGQCTCGKCGKGKNNLGKILMEVRKELKVQGLENILFKNM